MSSSLTERLLFLSGSLVSPVLEQQEKIHVTQYKAHLNDENQELLMDLRSSIIINVL